MEKDKRMVRRISVAVALATPLALIIVVSLAWPASAAGPGQGVPAPSAAAPVADPAVEVVDGAQTPERIPDETAYRLVFRLVTALLAKGDEQSARAYVSSLGLGPGCGACPKSGGAATDREVDTVLGAVAEYRQRMAALDGRAMALRASGQGLDESERQAKLAQLNQDREIVVQEVVALLRTELPAAAFARLQDKLNSHVKPRVKIRRPKATS